MERIIVGTLATNNLWVEFRQYKPMDKLGCGE
jgi:hypothetical protein